MTPTTRKIQRPALNVRIGYPVLWAALEEISTRMAVAKDNVLFQQGDTGRGVFLLRKGKVRLFLRGPGRRQVPYRIAGPGDILGLPATLSHGSYSLTAKNLADCELGFARAENVIELLSKRGDVCFQAVEVMAYEVRRLRKKQAGHVPLNSTEQL